MMRIKNYPEDFIVKEINNNIKTEGKFNAYLLTKKNIGTIDAIKKLEKELFCKLTYSGNKDKVAITSQFVSSNKKVPNKEILGDSFSIIFKHVGYVDEPLSLGSHQENYFEIVTSVKKDSCKINSFSFPNYFGEQRFSNHNIAIGKALLRRDFDIVTSLLKQDIVYGKKVAEYLTIKPHDYLGAIKILPRKLLRLILSSVQSYFFNKELSSFLNDGKLIEVSSQKLFFKEYWGTEEFLLPGWDTSFVDEGIDSQKFLFREYPEISLEGEKRKGFVKARNIVWDGKKISFILPKGSYATIFLRTFFNESIEF